MKILFIGHYWKDFQTTFREKLAACHEVLFFGRTRDPGLAEQLPTAHVIVSSSLPADLGSATRALRLVHSAGAGVDKIDMSAVAEGVPLCCTFHHGPSIAEYVVMAMLALHRELFRMDRELRAGRWLNPGTDPRVPFHSTLEGETVLLLGTGEIGSHVALRCRAFGMRVIGINSSGQAPERGGFDQVAPWASLDELLPRARFVVLALPLTEETRGAIDARRLGLMNASSYLINVARGPLIEEAALFEALENRRIAGAAIDVWYRYPKDPDEPAPPSAMPFQDLDNVIMTPHAAGNTTATFGQRAGDIIDNIERLDRGEPLRNVVGAGNRRS